jgi:hypothetical protein
MTKEERSERTEWRRLMHRDGARPARPCSRRGRCRMLCRRLGLSPPGRLRAWYCGDGDPGQKGIQT